jgi:hypothetical protein
VWPNALKIGFRSALKQVRRRHGFHAVAKHCPPGVIDTPIWTKKRASAGSDAPIDPNEVARGGVLLGSGRTAQKIANRVLFLVSDLTRYMTGAKLAIDGGMTGGARPRGPEPESLRGQSPQHPQLRVQRNLPEEYAAVLSGRLIAAGCDNLG